MLSVDDCDIIEFVLGIAEATTLETSLVEYTRERLAARIGDRNEAKVEQALATFQKSLDIRWSAADTAEKQQNLLQHALQFTSHPTIINTGTQKGTLFDLQLELVANVTTSKAPLRVDVFAISKVRYAELLRKEDEWHRAGQVGAEWPKDWFDRELINHMPNGPANDGDVIPLSAAPGVLNYGWLKLVESDVVDNASARKFVAVIKDVRLDKVPNSVSPNGSSDSKSTNGDRKKLRAIKPTAAASNAALAEKAREQVKKVDRCADDAYYLVAVVPQLSIRAYTLPLCIVTNASQYGKCSGTLFWHDACSHRMHLDLPTKISRAGSGLVCGMPEHTKEKIAVEDFKLYFSWYFRMLVSDYIQTNLNEMSLEFLIRKAMAGPEAAHIAGFFCQGKSRCSFCEAAQGHISETGEPFPTEYISWPAFEQMQEWFYRACKFIKYLEEQALKEADTNEQNQSFSRGGQPYRGLWDSGILQLISKKQACQLLGMTHGAVFQNPAARQLLLRISEEGLEAVSIYSISNQGKIVRMKAQTKDFFQKLPLANALCSSTELRRFGVCSVYPGISFDQLKQWCQLTMPQAQARSGSVSNKYRSTSSEMDGSSAQLEPYVASPCKLQCIDFIEKLDDGHMEPIPSFPMPAYNSYENCEQHFDDNSQLPATSFQMQGLTML